LSTCCRGFNAGAHLPWAQNELYDSVYVGSDQSKAIGVRKVLGASVVSISWMLSATFTRPIAFDWTLSIPHYIVNLLHDY
jgi:hypothetical protein